MRLRISKSIVYLILSMGIVGMYSAKKIIADATQVPEHEQTEVGISFGPSGTGFIPDPDPQKPEVTFPDQTLPGAPVTISNGQLVPKPFSNGRLAHLPQTSERTQPHLLVLGLGMELTVILGSMLLHIRRRQEG